MNAVITNGTKLLCVDDSKQSIVRKGRVYTALVRDGFNSGAGRVHIQEHKRFALLSSRFEVIDEFKY